MSLVLGIETSCDETSAAVVRDGADVLSNVISSQVDLHAHYGGVVPELASRRHLERILPVIDQALVTADVALTDIDLIAATRGPGLLGALLVGLSAARGLAFALGRPLVGVHHIEAHIYAALLDRGEPPAWPVVALVVSGGHTDIVLVRGHGRYRVLGRTRDDAAGEAFDKTARLMGLGFPGGPEIDRLSGDGDSSAIDFPRAYLEPGSLDFSFSGLKTAVSLYLQRTGAKANPADVAASFQQAVIDVLVDKAMLATETVGARTLLLVGGVAANRRLRRALVDRGSEAGVDVWCPPLALCTDNAAMIAACGEHMYRRGVTSPLDVDAAADLDLETYTGEADCAQG